MNKFFTIVGIIVVVWIAISLLGWLLGFLIKSIFWIAIIVGAVYVVLTLAAKLKGKSPGGR